MNQGSSSSSSQVPSHQLLAEFERISLIFNQAFASLDNTPTTADPITSDLIRIPHLTSDDHVYYRDLFRRTRRLFDSLRLNPLITKDAASLMRSANLSLYHDVKIEGELPGLCIGDVFISKTEMSVVGLRGHENDINDNVLMYGNFSNGECAAICVIVNEVNDDVVSVGREKNKLALKMSMDYGIEVRVVRSLVYGGMKVYVYDGLYKVVSTWVKVKKNKVDDVVFKFRVVRVENQVETGSEIMRMALKLKIMPVEIRPRGYISLDLSNKMERFPVLVYNEVDGNCDPLKYQYLVTSVCPSHVYGIVNGTGCECVGDCADNCLCATRNGDDGWFPYDHNRTLVRGKRLVYECGPNCQCPPTCRNRVTQKRTKYRFEVFRKKGGAWGVKSLDLIQAGSFICEYTGVYLRHDQAEIYTMNGDILIYSTRFAETWKQWGDLSQIFPEYVSPTSPSIPPVDFAMDVSLMRNLACYISYTSTPNVFVQPVLYDHNSVHFPHLMLFALENIPPMRDLELNYLDNKVEDEKLAVRNLVFR